MNDEEMALAKFVYRTMMLESSESERSLQTASYEMGVSDIGHCQEYARRLLIQEPPSNPDRDFSAAFLGTAVGDALERGLVKRWPGTAAQESVVVKVSGEQGDYEIKGHPDLVRSNFLGDVKTVDGLSKVKRSGPSKQQLFQRHLYALGCHQKGLFDVPLEEVKTANIWIDRSGREHQVFVHMDTYSQDIVDEAVRWLDDVIYAAKMGEEAQKQPARSFCENWCVYYDNCRAGDTDVTGLIDDIDVIAAVDLYLDAKEMEKRARIMTREAQAQLDGINGSTGKHTIRWTWVNPSQYTVNREGYYRLGVNKAKAPPKPKENEGAVTNNLDG